MKRYISVGLIVLAIVILSTFSIGIASNSLRISIFFLVIPYLLVGVYEIFKLESWYIRLGLSLSIIVLITFNIELLLCTAP